MYIMIYIFLLLITLIFLKKNKKNFKVYSNYEKYKLGEIVYPIINTNSESKEAIMINNLINTISTLDGFDHKSASNLLLPYTKLSTANEKWGVFSNLNLDLAMKELNTKKNDLDLTLGKFKDLYKLNKVQKKSIENYIKKQELIFKTKEILFLKNNDFKHCKELINLYLSNKFNENEIYINFYDDYNNISNKLNLLNYDKLLILYNVLNVIPLNVCEIIELVIDTEIIRNNKLENTLNECKTDIINYIKIQYESMGIKPKNKDIFKDNIIEYNEGDIKKIKDIYKYLFLNDEDKCKSIKKINESKDSKKYLEHNKYHYKKNLIDNINKIKLSKQIINCNKDINIYLNHKFDLYNIPKNLDNDLKLYTISKLEMIHEVFKGLPNCNHFEKKKIIDKINTRIYTMKLLGGHAFDCNDHLNTYLKKEFIKNNLQLPVPKKESEYLSYNITDLLMIDNIYRKVPACKDLTKIGEKHFEERINEYLKFYNKKIDYRGSDKENNPTAHYIKAHYPDYHPYYKGDWSPKEEIRYDDVISEAELDKYFEDNLFEKQDTIEDKLDKINKKIDKCCANDKCNVIKKDQNENKNNKNNEDKRNVNDYFRKLIEQNKIKGSTSIFLPEIVIDTDGEGIEIS